MILHSFFVDNKTLSRAGRFIMRARTNFVPDKPSARRSLNLILSASVTLCVLFGCGQKNHVLSPFNATRPTTIDSDGAIADGENNKIDGYMFTSIYIVYAPADFPKEPRWGFIEWNVRIGRLNVYQTNRRTGGGYKAVDSSSKTKERLQVLVPRQDPVVVNQRSVRVSFSRASFDTSKFTAVESGTHAFSANCDSGGAKGGGATLPTESLPAEEITEYFSVRYECHTIYDDSENENLTGICVPAG